MAVSPDVLNQRIGNLYVGLRRRFISENLPEEEFRNAVNGFIAAIPDYIAREAERSRQENELRLKQARENIARRTGVLIDTGEGEVIDLRTGEEVPQDPVTGEYHIPSITVYPYYNQFGNRVIPIGATRYYCAVHYLAWNTQGEGPMRVNEHELQLIIGDFWAGPFIWNTLKGNYLLGAGADRMSFYIVADGVFEWPVRDIAFANDNFIGWEEPAEGENWRPESVGELHNIRVCLALSGQTDAVNFANDLSVPSFNKSRFWGS